MKYTYTRRFFCITHKIPFQAGLLLLVLLSPLLLRGQVVNNKQRVIYGNIVDNLTRKNLLNVKVYRLNTDSTVADSCNTSANLNVMDIYDLYGFSVPREGGDWILRVVFEGYETVTQKVHVPPFKSRQLVLRLPDIRLKRKPKEKKLEGAVVRATKIKFYHHGDTLIYNADAFNLAQGSMLDALIRQLPGVELKDDGEIFVNGNKVESLLLNGEDFFKNNRQLMLDNLPACTVKDVQVYRKRDDLSEWAGRDIKEKEMVMNVKLKKEYNTNWIGNIEVGAGTEDRYMARLFAMRFTDHSSVSFFGNMNNMNDKRRPGQSGEWTPDKMPSGHEATKFFGTDYTVKDRQKRYKIHGDAQLTHSDGDYLSTTTGENFLPKGNTYELSQNHSQNRRTDFSTSHKWTVGDSFQAQELSWNFNWSKWKNGANAASATFSEDPYGYGGNLLDSIRQMNAGSLLRRLAMNRYIEESLNDGNNYHLALYPSLRFKSVGTDFYTLGGTLQFDGTRENQFSNNLYDYPQSQKDKTDFRRNFTERRSHAQYYLLATGYCLIFPNNLGIYPNVEISHSRGHEKDPLFRLDKEENWGAQDEHGIGSLPSETEFRLRTIDLQNSSWRHSVQNTYTPQVYCFWNTTDHTEKSYWKVEGNLALTFSNEKMNYVQANFDGTRKRHTVAFKPYFNFRHNWDNFNGEFRFAYDTGFGMPDLVNLLEIENNSDPLNIHNGNEDLKNTYRHTFAFNYRDRNISTQRQWGFNANYNIYRNAQAMAYTINRSTGIRYYHPENVNGNYKFDATANYSMPLDKQKRLMFSTSTYGQYSQNVDMIGNEYAQTAVLAEPLRSTVHITWITENLKMDYKMGKNTVGVKGYLSYNHAQSRREGFTAVHIWDFNYGLTGVLTLPWDIQLATDLTIYSRRGYDNPSSNTNDLVWNARLSKPFLHNNLIVTVDGFDMLNQLSNLTQTMNNQGRFETYRNALPRYVMLHLIYRLNIKAKKDQKN